jgi:uncharacterized protein (TIGR02391 family)
VAQTLLQIFPAAADLLALEPEDLAAVLIEVIPGASQGNAGCGIGDLMAQVVSVVPGQGYPHEKQRDVELAIAEALSWLATQGLVVLNPGQPHGRWYVLTRRGAALRTRANVGAYRLGRTLPIELLQPDLADKVHHLYVRGDYDTAIFQAFKEVEVAVRQAGGYTDDDLGVKLMHAAFNPDNGPLTDMEAVESERRAMMFLFSGAIGAAKNPSSHRRVKMNRQTAARLIVFASHLLEIVAVRELFR